MKNNWKYAILGERERLDLIKGGNNDVYNSEKERNKELKKLRSDLGLSTTDIDNWDSIIDNAKVEYGNRIKNQKPNLPKIVSGGKLAAINTQMRSTLKDLKKQRDESIESAKTDAEQALDYIAEYLASNGYSKDGSLSVKSKNVLEQALESMLEDIQKNYRNQVDTTVSKYRSMV